MTHEEVIADAKGRQELDPDASWIATSRHGDGTVFRIVKPELTLLRPAANQAARSRASSLSPRSGIWEGPPAL